ncbi:hypothetical protein LAUMK35_00630 [Mycobacterium pseudokansasii]|uniref:Uncharacterized protein n=1 Tax=Mycobacterium pseudokansasii TaxID=2341080 RepID=A0A498QLE9_9MYCO|nr:hypothetical protein A4G27_16175 [Mycobacterium kansasii]VAZ88680.1 hypothetical protein LAUMK35_00630 [Mycobacterium pseudokansasii]VBA46865.1 hypothetical protein LAUMK142_00505 [Mycobacterium pseudokansasii]
MAISPGASAALDDRTVGRGDGRALLNRRATRTTHAAAERGAFVAEDVAMRPAGCGSANSGLATKAGLATDTGGCAAQPGHRSAAQPGSAAADAGGCAGQAGMGAYAGPR